MTIRILLADDHEPTRAALRRILGLDRGIEVVAEAADGASAKRHIEELRPDLAILDLRLRDCNGFDLTAWVRQHAPATRTLLTSADGDRSTAERASAVGAQGFVPKEAAFEELAAAAHEAAAGRPYRSPLLFGKPEERTRRAGDSD